MDLKKYKVSYDKALAMGPEKFVKNHLFPFMRRENGNGFAMSTWASRTSERKGTPIIEGYDNIGRVIPACKSFYCIGGSMQAIVNKLPDFTENHNYSEHWYSRELQEDKNQKYASILGLTVEQTSKLFFGWQDRNSIWTAQLQAKWKAAKTPLQKEKVAEAVVLHAIKLGKKRK